MLTNNSDVVLQSRVYFSIAVALGVVYTKVALIEVFVGVGMKKDDGSGWCCWCVVGTEGPM